MRSLLITSLSLVELVLGCAILACSFELSGLLERNEAIARLAHVVVCSTQQLAHLQLHISLRYGA